MQLRHASWGFAWLDQRKMGKTVAADAYDAVHPPKGFLKGRIGKLPAAYKKMDNEEAARIKTAPGHGVSGRVHVLTDSGLRHIHKKYGSAKQAP